MILIADSGSTKTDWGLVDGQQLTARYTTQGINPFHQSADAIGAVLRDELLPQLGTAAVDAVYFYGSGCREELVPVVRQCLAATVGGSRIDVAGDMVGAARAVCGRQPGMAAILGTGANSCLYDGEHMVQNTPPLGYILGDEGSGAVLGRRFFNAIFKSPDFSDLRRQYEAETGLGMADVVERVYRQPMANRFLASTSLFIRAHVGHPLLHRLVVDNFRAFFRRNLVPYGRPDLPVGFVGSVAWHYGSQLAEAAREEGFGMGRVLQSPMEGLVSYHVAVEDVG